jgi:hypothetical protein
MAFEGAGRTEEKAAAAKNAAITIKVNRGVKEGCDDVSLHTSNHLKQ